MTKLPLQLAGPVPTFPSHGTSWLKLTVGIMCCHHPQ